MEPASPIVAQLHKALTEEFRSKQAPDLNTDSLEAARSNLDKDIEAAELAFRAYEAYASRELEALRLRRNQLVPISRLPNEILSSAFCFAVWGLNRYTASIQSLFTISSVCRAWRDVALQSPRLWTRLERLPLPLFSLLLTRSKQAPLDIVFDQEFERLTGESALSEYIALISQHARQWRTLIFCFPSFDEIMPLLPLPATHLKVLVLDCGSPLDVHGSDSLELFPHPFADHTPNLRELTLGAIFVPFTHPIYSNLVKLDIKNIEYGKLDSMKEFFQVLEASPLLEDLSLRFLVLSFPSVAGPSGLVSLPRLRALKLVFLQPIWAPAYFLSHLSVPSSAYLEIIGDTELGNDMSTILPPYSSTHRNLPNLSSITTLSIHVQDCTCAVRGSALEEELFFFEFVGDSLEDLETIVSSLGRVFPMPSLDSVFFLDFHLEVSDEANLELATACREFLVRHPTIKDLAFYDSHQSMLEILSTATPSLVCPQLESLIIERCPLSPKRLFDAVELRTTPRIAKAKDGGGSDSEMSNKCLLLVDIRGCPQFTKTHLSKLRKRVKVAYKKKAPRYSDESE
ncbi:hypothetical protein BOTBODRAFT_33167 [Botryobasidium botryosum FD-172 SS1]|uniref:F-box domain-containing protein n=1 Tax=Botryobasidium botryosum (strain FD-172 SS1) TaxID=930990 RepID=A0A067MR38_BOTB1|nr:hypothetical protein BOTBODRAFT_33167 [Botryobasidium botryosum FD-172 SS1]